jgi:hypothetical protein
MTAAELIEVLSELDPDTEVLLSIVSPLEDGDTELATDLYPVGGVIPMDADPDDEDEDGPCVWLVGGEDDDVERLFAELDEMDDEE